MNATTIRFFINVRSFVLLFNQDVEHRGPMRNVLPKKGRKGRRGEGEDVRSTFLNSFARKIESRKVDRNCPYEFSFSRIHCLLKFNLSLPPQIFPFVES